MKVKQILQLIATLIIVILIKIRRQIIDQIAIIQVNLIIQISQAVIRINQVVIQVNQIITKVQEIQQQNLMKEIIIVV